MIRTTIKSLGAVAILAISSTTVQAATVEIVGGPGVTGEGTNSVTVAPGEVFTMIITGSNFTLVPDPVFGGMVADMTSFGLNLMYPSPSLVLDAWSFVSPYFQGLPADHSTPGELLGLNGFAPVQPPMTTAFDMVILTFTAGAASGGPIDLLPILSGLGFTHLDGTVYTAGELDVIGATVLVTPIPPAILLFATALGALGFVRRRRGTVPA